MLMELASRSQRLRAPQDDGQTLVEPPRTSLPGVVARNRRQLALLQYDFQGRSLADLAAAARGALIERAIAYTRQYRDLPEPLSDPPNARDAPLLLAGHQPQLFHPGVWYKNFLLGDVAQRVGGVGVHLLIDSDLCRSAAIWVPTGSADSPRVEAVPYDQPAMEVPYEERAIRDHATLASFAQRAASLIRPLVDKPLVESLWPLVLERNPQEPNLGRRLAQGRHALEATWQNPTLELPQSSVCQLPEFAWFVAGVLAHLPRFWSAHNDALAAYRAEHRLRNRAHPVPDLVADADGWLEAPFWIWTADDPRRRPLFARQCGDELIVSDRAAQTIRLELSADRDASTAVEQLLGLASRGVKIRTRALTTTLFARLLLADLFLHGIGGAKYDQVTDQIANAFFGCALPEFATVSATLRLPIARRPARGSQCQWQNELRELQFHPERFLDTDARDASDGAGPGREAIAAKRRWIETPKTADNARQRHLAITAANEALQPLVADRRQQLERQREACLLRQRADKILNSREYSFCLFPRAHFERLLQSRSPQM